MPERGDVLTSEWGREHVRLPGSALTERFDPRLTPWVVAPIDTFGDGVTTDMTHVGPVQSGKSVGGEVIMCRHIGAGNGGDLMLGFETEAKTKARMKQRVGPVLKKCRPVVLRMPTEKKNDTTMQIVFPHMTMRATGVESSTNLESDSYKVIVAEEVFAWPTGRLQLMENRTAAFAFPFRAVISTGGRVGDDLYRKLHASRLRYWGSHCPGCGELHFMHDDFIDRADAENATKAKAARLLGVDEAGIRMEIPELFGGLRYDRGERGSVPDFARVAATLRYEMPCGYEVPYDAQARRQLSLRGDYLPAINPEAPERMKAFAMQSVAVERVDWLDLVKEKHAALDALRNGNPTAWINYTQRRCAQFWDEDRQPTAHRITLSSDVSKARAGLPDRVLRTAALDRQLGQKDKGELPHWWLTIWDFNEPGDGGLVYEGKMETDGNAAATITEHSVEPWNVCADSGADTDHVYSFCLEHGYHAIKGGKSEWYNWEDGSKRAYSEMQFIATVANLPRGSHGEKEPYFWQYSKHQIREFYWHARNAQVIDGVEPVKRIIPSDVSADYLAHSSAENREVNPVGRTKELKPEWIQVRKRNDLFVCDCYCEMMWQIWRDFN